MAKLKRDLISATAQIAELGDKYRKVERERNEYESMYNSILVQYAELKVKLNAIEQDKPKVEPKLLSDLSWVKWIAKDKSGNIWAYSDKPEKLKSEPSILTELDELRTANKQLSYHCDKYKDLIDSRMTTIRKRDGRIAELEKELSDLRSSCDDSFLNTVERANQLSIKCASLENIIAEFDVYKKDAQEVHDKLIKLYESEQTIRNNLLSHIVTGKQIGRASCRERVLRLV